MARNSSENENPLQNVFTRHIEKMQERIDRIRTRQQEAIKARMLEQQLENCILADTDIGLNPVLTKAIVSNDMAMSRIQDTYSARADVVARIDREGATAELQEALARATVMLGAQIGEVFANIDEAYDAMSRDQGNSIQDYQSEQLEQSDIPRYTSNDNANTGSQQERVGAGRTQARLVSAYRSSPPSGLVINTAT